MGYRFLDNVELPFKPKVDDVPAAEVCAATFTVAERVDAAAELVRTHPV